MKNRISLSEIKETQYKSQELEEDTINIHFKIYDSLKDKTVMEIGIEVEKLKTDGKHFVNIYDLVTGEKEFTDIDQAFEFARNYIKKAHQYYTRMIENINEMHALISS